MFRVTAALPLLAAVLLAPLGAPSLAQDAKDPKAEAIAARVQEALGGKKAWDETRYLKWTFAGRRSHTWDKWTGRHRLEGKNKDGAPYVILDNLNTKTGEAWVNGKKVEGDEAKKMVENAYGAWVNDSYWLLAPYKIQDPGVNLSSAGEETIDGKTYDKLALSFGKVGLTPGDRYWMYVNRDTGLVDRWAYRLQDQPADAAPTPWSWEGWQTYGKIRLAPTRIQVGATPERKLELGDLQVPDTLPDTVFTQP